MFSPVTTWGPGGSHCKVPWLQSTDPTAFKPGATGKGTRARKGIPSQELHGLDGRVPGLRECVWAGRQVETRMPNHLQGTPPPGAEALPPGNITSRDITSRGYHL